MIERRFHGVLPWFHQFSQGVSRGGLESWPAINAADAAPAPECGAPRLATSPSWGIGTTLG
jgi:hypothetical protein